MTGTELVYAALPIRIKRAVERAAEFCGLCPLEIHICLGSGSSVRFASGKTYLGVSVFERDIENILAEFTGRALYAHRDTLREGFLSLGGGVRVGVCGQARYEGGSLVGVSSVSSLLIRIPTSECSFADRLADAFLVCKRGMLIFAPPSGGKTTALRALILRLSELGAGRISIIDERGELDTGAFAFCDVDLFRGYRRSQGMEIALRVMSPEIIAVDELGSGAENCEILESLFGGVRFIATAHASSLEELKKRKNLEPFFRMEAFDSYARIFRSDRGFECEIIDNDTFLEMGRAKRSEALRNDSDFSIGGDIFL